MANNVTASFPEYWSRRMQRKHYKQDRYRVLVSMEEQATLKKGDTVHRPYRSDFTVNTLGSEGSYTRQDITDTDESLVINKEKEVSFYVRDIDKMQSNYNTVNEYADDAAIQLGNQIDGDVLGEYDQAASNVDAGDLGGTAGDGIQLSAANILRTVVKANEKLDALNIPTEGRVGLVSPQFKAVLLEYLGGKESALGDSTSMNGHIGRFQGFDLYVSNALGWSGVLSLVTQPTADDTITINGVTFTFKASAAAAGEVTIGANVDATRANLANAINNTSTGFVAVSAANLKLLKNITATNDNTANTLTLKATGRSYVVVSEALTDATDTWTATKQVQHQLFGKKGAVDLVIQKYPNMRVKPRDGYIGDDIVTWAVYGYKTFAEGTRMLVDVQVRSDAF